MKKISKYILILFTILLIIPNSVQAKEKIKIYLFWGDGCPHCEAEQQYLKNLQKDYPNIEIEKYEVWNHPENSQLLDEIATKMNKKALGVPVTIIGTSMINGFAEATEKQIERALTYYQEHEYQDVVRQIKEGTYSEEALPAIEDEFTKEEEKTDKDNTIELPILNKVNLKNMDFLTAVSTLGFFDSLSLLPLGVMLLLVLLCLKDKKKYLLTIISFLSYTFLWLLFQSQNFTISPTILLPLKIITVVVTILALVRNWTNRTIPAPEKSIYLLTIIVGSAILIPSKYLISFQQVMEFHHIEGIGLLGNYFVYGLFYSFLYLILGYILLKIGDKYFIIKSKTKL